LAHSGWIGRLPWRSLSLAAVVLATAAVPGNLSLLAYERSRVASGEVWRLVTAHLTHVGSAHLVWDVLPLLAIGALWEKALGRRFFPVLLASTLAVSLGLFVLAPRVETYCGLSGVLNGLWVAGAWTAARQEAAAGHRSVAILFRASVVVDLARAVFETTTGIPVLVDPTGFGGTPVPIAHALGALGGLLVCLGPRSVDHYRRKKAPRLARSAASPCD